MSFVHVKDTKILYFVLKSYLITVSHLKVFQTLTNFECEYSHRRHVIKKRTIDNTLVYPLEVNTEMIENLISAKNLKQKRSSNSIDFNYYFLNLS